MGVSAPALTKTAKEAGGSINIVELPQHAIQQLDISVITTLLQKYGPAQGLRLSLRMLSRKHRKFEKCQGAMIIDFDGVNKALGKNERPYEVNGVKVIQDYTTFALTAARLAVDLGDEDPQVLAAFKTATEKEEDMLESFNGDKPRLRNQMNIELIWILVKLQQDGIFPRFLYCIAPNAADEVFLQVGQLVAGSTLLKNHLLQLSNNAGGLIYNSWPTLFTETRNTKLRISVANTADSVDRLSGRDSISVVVSSVTTDLSSTYRTGTISPAVPVITKSWDSKNGEVSSVMDPVAALAGLVEKYTPKSGVPGLLLAIDGPGDYGLHAPGTRIGIMTIVPRIEKDVGEDGVIDWGNSVLTMLKSKTAKEIVKALESKELGGLLPFQLGQAVLAAIGLSGFQDIRMALGAVAPDLVRLVFNEHGLELPTREVACLNVRAGFATIDLQTTKTLLKSLGTMEELLTTLELSLPDNIDDMNKFEVDGVLDDFGRAFKMIHPSYPKNGQLILENYSNEDVLKHALPSDWLDEKRKTRFISSLNSFTRSNTGIAPDGSIHYSINKEDIPSQLSLDLKTVTEEEAEESKSDYAAMQGEQKEFRELKWLGPMNEEVDGLMKGGHLLRLKVPGTTDDSDSESNYNSDSGPSIETSSSYSKDNTVTRGEFNDDDDDDMGRPKQKKTRIRNPAIESQIIYYQEEIQTLIQTQFLARPSLFSLSIIETMSRMSTYFLAHPHFRNRMRKLHGALSTLFNKVPTDATSITTAAVRGGIKGIAEFLKFIGFNIKTATTEIREQLPKILSSPFASDHPNFLLAALAPHDIVGKHIKPLKNPTNAAKLMIILRFFEENFDNGYVGKVFSRDAISQEELALAVASVLKQRWHSTYFSSILPFFKNDLQHIKDSDGNSLVMRIRGGIDWKHYFNVISGPSVISTSSALSPSTSNPSPSVSSNSTVSSTSTLNSNPIPSTSNTSRSSRSKGPAPIASTSQKRPTSNSIIATTDAEFLLQDRSLPLKRIAPKSTLKASDRDEEIYITGMRRFPNFGEKKQFQYMMDLYARDPSIGRVLLRYLEVRLAFNEETEEFIVTADLNPPSAAAPKLNGMMHLALHLCAATPITRIQHEANLKREGLKMDKKAKNYQELEAAKGWKEAMLDVNGFLASGNLSSTYRGLKKFIDGGGVGHALDALAELGMVLGESGALSSSKRIRRD